MRVQPETALLEVVAAHAAATGLTGRLHGGQQESDQHADNGDHHEQFHKREAALLRA
jgi:hypothetical protein